MGQRRRHPTIRDVAERAGVSKSLVSLVMRNAPNVSDAKRKAVLRAASELGYRPNVWARSLVQQRTSLVGMVLSDLHNPFFAGVVDGAHSALDESPYRAVFATGNRSAKREAEAIASLLHLRVDGVVLAGSALPITQVEATAGETPVVLASRATRSETIDSVTNDDIAGAKLAVDHLVELGHRRIAHIHGSSGAGARARRRGYEQAMRAHDLAKYISSMPGSFTEEGGAKGMRALLASRPRHTAVFAANDLAAIGALGVLAEAGIRVPDQMSVVGYDDTELAALSPISLTTVHQPVGEMGKTAIELLLERIDGDRSEAVHVVLPPSFVVRATTAPPP